jgi:molecular chaperone GrpE
MADRHRNDPEEISPREHHDTGAMADGDASLRQEPPNVTSAEPAPEADSDDDAAAYAEGGDGAGAADVATAKQELATMSDRMMRLAAEFDNFRKRSERERADTWARAQADLAGRLLDTLDDLERVIQHSDDTEDSMLQGVRLVERKLRQALSAAGLEAVDAENAPFDPNIMEAVAMVGADSKDEDDVVSDVFQRGYTFKGTLLRPARVRVKKHGA